MDESKVDFKKQIIQIAKSWPLYFCRLFPIELNHNKFTAVFMLGISHSGIRLIKLEKSKQFENGVLAIIEEHKYLNNKKKSY